MLAALEEDEYPRTFIDTETGALVEIPSVDSLELWTRAGGIAPRYVLIEHMQSDARDAAMRAFIEEVLVVHAPEEALAMRAALARGGWQAAEDYLVGHAEMWCDAWDDLLEDEAWGYVHEWLTEHPDLGIETVFEGCGHCAVCEVVEKGEGDDKKKLAEAFATEDVMRRVAAQMEDYSRRKASGRCIGEKGDEKSE